MNTTQQHPSSDQLLQFAHGKLRDSELARVEEHIATCDTCCEWIATQPDNTLIALAREVATINVRGPARLSPAIAKEIPTALVDHPRYRVIEQIGFGGMGAVFQAEHRLMQRMVALKMVQPFLLNNEQAVERFRREVQVAARLTHPNIVAAYDADQAGGLNFLVMEYVAGESLEQRIARQGPAAVVDAIDWIHQAALGLQHAYEQGMAHRDIKPQNLMITADNQIKILDFGLSRLVKERATDSGMLLPDSNTAGETHAHTILGTPDYIAPEQIASSRSADTRADIYSLGCTLFFLLTGRPPFAEGTVSEKLEAHQRAPLPRVHDIRPDVPSGLDGVLQRMTAKRPDERFATPGDVAVALSSLKIQTKEQPPTSIADVAESSPRSRSISRRGFAAILVLGGLLFLGYTARGYIVPAVGSRPPTRLLVMLPSQGLWFPDYQQLVDAANSSNTTLTFASRVAEPSQVLSTSIPGVAVPDVQLNGHLAANDYDGIVFIGYDTTEFSPGGSAGPDIRRLLNDFQLQKKVVSSLCAGQRVLAQHGALRGKRVAPCVSVKPDEIRYEGGTQTAENVVSDGLVVTASEAEYAAEFLAAIEKVRRP